MPIRFLIWLSFLWFGLHFLMGIAQVNIDGALDPSSNAPLANIAFISIVDMQEVFILPFKIPLPSATFFDDLQTLLFWNYPYFQNSTGWVFVRIFFLLPISFATVMLFLTVLSPLIISVGALVTNTFIGPIVRRLTGG